MFLSHYFLTFRFLSHRGGAWLSVSLGLDSGILGFLRRVHVHVLFGGEMLGLLLRVLPLLDLIIQLVIAPFEHRSTPSTTTTQ